MSRTILVPLDDSPQSANALEHARTVHPESDLVLLHVIDYSESLTDPNRGGRGQLEGWYQKATEDAEALLEDARGDISATDIELTTVVRDGKPAEEVLLCADEYDVDQIIMGSHGRTGVARILLGSVAEQVVRRSECPTTVVH